MTVAELNRYKLYLEVIRNRINEYRDKNSSMLGDEFEDSIYLPTISMIVDFEKAIDYAINCSEVHFFS